MTPTQDTPKHTPGPWTVRDEHVGPHRMHYRIIAEGGAVVTKWVGDYDERANADLITAAPDMLVALKRAVAVLDAAGIVYGDSDEEPLDVLNESREAIAKAEGR